MTKTPDEIKKGLECCATVKVGGVCPFDCPLQPLCASGDDGTVQREILALIQQLQAENAEKAERIHQLEAERDAAVESMRSDPHCCYHCANMTKRGICQSEPRADGHCFEWHGVQKEDTDAVSS